MDDSRLITVAIHTFDKAQELKATLEREGVNVTLQNVNLATPVVSSGVRVRISERDLPLALRIIENPEIFAPNAEAEKSNSESSGHTVLIPVDFSDRSYDAIRAGFSAAAQAGDRVMLLHTFLVPRSNSFISMSASLTFDSSAENIEEMEDSARIATDAHGMMSRLSKKIREGIKSGDIAAAKFGSVLLEGVPEECICQYVKDHPNVRLIVMSTRAASQKAHDLEGSITAEVLDNCRTLALTIPEGLKRHFTSLEQVDSAILISNLEQEDFLALDTLNRLLPEGKPISVTVVCLPNNKYTKATNEAAREALKEYCDEHFPNYSFTIREPNKDLKDLSNEHADLIVVPNRKKNIFARLFNPGLAHRIIFHADIPMMVIPV